MTLFQRVLMPIGSAFVVALALALVDSPARAQSSCSSSPVAGLYPQGSTPTDGIGSSVAMNASGDRVFVGDVLEASSQTGGASASSSPVFLECDVARREDIEALFDRAVADTGRVDVVFNNVGIARYGEVDKLSLEDWQLTLDVNLTAQFVACKRAVAEMKPRSTRLSTVESNPASLGIPYEP